MMRMRVAEGTQFVLATVMCGFILVSWGMAEEPLRYNRDIRPLLAEYCFTCHGPDSAARKAELRLDQRDVAVARGAILEGNPDGGELVARIESTDPDLVMPPHETKKKLSRHERNVLRRWIAEGAAYEQHWSLVTPERPVLPNVNDTAWPKNEIDYFILAKLEEAGLVPAPSADPGVLCRRLHLDITGLPPTPEEVREFTQQYSSASEVALSQWIDKLMRRPTWGEHRARYWLDAARYGDTHGLHFDNYREMWPYRDWVIRAFNSNQPFDEFTIDQIAGDLRPDPTQDQLIATGFQRCNITTNEGGTIDEENLANYAADRVQTIGWVYLGMTTNCAQCHDHKFDHFTAQDYYSLAAFFRNTTQRAKDGNRKDGNGPVMVVPNAEDLERWRALPEQLAQQQRAVANRRESAKGEFEHWARSALVEVLDERIPDQGLQIALRLDGEVSAASVESTGQITWREDGKLGPAPQFSDGSTFLVKGHGDFECDQAFSVGAWVRPAAENVTGAILAKMDEQQGARGWDLFQNSRKLSVHLVDHWPESAIKVSTRDDVLSSKQWHYVFVTYDGSRKPEGVRVYIDGVIQLTNVEAKSLKSDASIRTVKPLRIGQRDGGKVYEGGSVQGVRIYDRQLSDQEVASLMNLSALRSYLARPDSNGDLSPALHEHYLAEFDEPFRAAFAKVAALKAEQDQIRGRSPVTHVQRERSDRQPMAAILMRGAYDKPGEMVEAAVPAALHKLPVGAPQNRLGLAQWLVDPSNALTARVTVNRFWQEVFGQGIVVTSEDFGVMGTPPSHPDLLDWLSVDFRESGWDVKRFFKQILMSASYRQAATTSPEKIESDRDNMLLSRGPRFRMDAEMVRDYALAVSGLLSPTMFGPGTRPYQPSNIWEIVGLPGGDTRNYVQDHGDNLYRRTVYNFWKRMAPPPNLESFNAPSREFCTVRRERTNTPLQALVTLNDPQFVEAARRLAQIVLSGRGERSDDQILGDIVWRALCREIDEAERSILLGQKGALESFYRSHADAALALVSVGESSYDKDLDSVDLATWTMVCNQILNLDEVLNK